MTKKKIPYKNIIIVLTLDHILHSFVILAVFIVMLTTNNRR